ncbi:phosducin-like protein [Littorina saxatilis]|uniref:Phosducin domain-containing protein n=1 Tax=Littorina saxatilis TaxID=31220 RepID=A0AAN9BAS5_9CAEN
MAVSMDDKLLGEKAHYYCSSSEDEAEPDEDDKDESDEAAKQPEPEIEPPTVEPYSGSCTNTGPKGVIKDWREFKKLETEKRQMQERERQSLAKKLTLTCRSHLNDEEEQKADEKFLEQLGELEDEFIKEYRLQRIEEMRKALEKVPQFGKVVRLSGDNFIQEIDKERPCVTIIVHIYEDKVDACEAMNGCLMCLAREYPTVKFCKITATDAKLSSHFTVAGVPALLIYKNGELIGNFLQLSKEFGDDFYATDVESFLEEHGLLPSKTGMPVIRDKTTGEMRTTLPQDEEDSGSDFDVD